MSRMEPYYKYAETTTWNVRVNDGDSVPYDDIKVVLLTDIREELKKLNRLLSCSNFTGIPQTLRRIDTNTRKRKRRKA